MNYKLKHKQKMKNTIVFIVFISISLYGISQDFVSTLKDAVAAFDSSKNVNEMRTNLNRMQLIANKWNDEWAGHYYASYAYTIIALNESDPERKDALLDEADKQLETAKTLTKEKDEEFYVLAAMIANGRISVAPSTRWKKYGDIFEENLEAAKKLNPDNPRIYYLKGISLYHTPKTFGGGAKGAYPNFEKAQELFQKDPYWGRHHNAYMLQECKKEM